MRNMYRFDVYWRLEGDEPATWGCVGGLEAVDSEAAVRFTLESIPETESAIYIRVYFRNHLNWASGKYTKVSKWEKES